MEYEHNILGPDGKIITRNFSRLLKKIFWVFTRGGEWVLEYILSIKNDKYKAYTLKTKFGRN